MDTRDRRGFLRLVLAAAATTCAGCSSPGATPASFGDVSAGKAGDLSVGSIVPLSGAPAFVARDAKGVYAMTTTCTHQACDLARQGRISQDRISCGCHGSVFDANGGVVNGPASEPLQHFGVSADAQGNLTVHGGQEVGADVRLAV